MKDLFKEYLFTKHILVVEKVVDPEESFSTLVALKNKFGINVNKHPNGACKEMIEFTADQLGEYVPAPFYQGFPQSVRKLTEDQLLFDQLFHYFTTYGNGDFTIPGHSIFEKDFERLAFNEDVERKEFDILTEDEANEYLVQCVEDLLKSSRPLNENTYLLVSGAMKEYIIIPEDIPCKQTVVRLLYDTKNTYRYSKYLKLEDVIKLVDYINYEAYGNENLKKLSFRNKDRKLITKVLNEIFDRGHIYTDNAFEKRKIWCGLLHHIHYKPQTEEARDFVKLIRNGTNLSVYSLTEVAMGNNPDMVACPEMAAEMLYTRKGTSVVVRNLNYLLSRCETEEDVKGVLSWVK